MSDQDDRERPVDRLATEVLGIPRYLAWIAGGGCGCVLAFVLLCLAFGVVGGTFAVLQERIGLVPAVLTYTAAAWLMVRLYRRSRGGRGGRST